MNKIIIFVFLLNFVACDYAKRNSVAPPFDPFSVFTGVAESEYRSMVKRAQEKYSCQNGRISNVTTYRFTGDASRSSHYVNPWSVTDTMAGSIVQIFIGKSADNDLLVVSRAKGLSGINLYATLYLCVGSESHPENKFLTASLIAPNFYTTGTLGLTHNERSCDFDGAEVNSYVCVDDSAFSMENSPPCPPGLIKFRKSFSGLCH